MKKNYINIERCCRVPLTYFSKFSLIAVLNIISLEIFFVSEKDYFLTQVKPPGTFLPSL